MKYQPRELIKAGGPALTNEIHRLCNVIRRKEGWPEQWQSQSLLPSHTRTVVRECCKGNDASQWENGKIDPLPRPNPLTDRHKKLHTWLRNGYLPTCKIWSRSLQGFLFPVCAKLRIKMFTRLLFFFFFWGSSYELQPRRLNRFSRVICQTTRFRAWMCLFGVRRQKVNIYTP